MCLWRAGVVRGLKIQEIVVWSGHGLVTARGGRVRAERSEVWVTHRAKRGHCTWRDMPSKARYGLESRAKRGVGYAMLVLMKERMDVTVLRSSVQSNMCLSAVIQ